MSKKALILEIGCEEIPAGPLRAATEQLIVLATDAFVEARLEHGEIIARSTPRRLILEVRDLAEASIPLVQRFRGPSVSIAFDAQGNPTKAAEGFARGKGLSVRDLTRTKEGEGEYVFATVEQISRKTEKLLPDILSELIANITWPKSQRWGSGEARFARPVRWLLALWGYDIIACTFAGLTANRITYGHRLLAPAEIEITSADELVRALTKAWVIPSPELRASHIKSQIAEIEKKTGLIAHVPQKTFDEVVNLVEYPTSLVGHFDEEFLAIPSEIITDAMLSHQRYFPLYTPEGVLSNAFVLVSNGSPGYSSVIIDGNERVVRPRLSDAAFFYHEDLKRPLVSYVDDLTKVVFHEKLGSLYEKACRMVDLAGEFALLAQGDEQEIDNARRAALLAKADLVTATVVEFTSLQGVMGSYYARAAGEPDAVALAIGEHYRPRFATDEVPSSFEGKVVALADKLDTICGIFAIGQGPTGSSDPFALRRSAIGSINILLSGLSVSLSVAIDVALAQYRGLVSDRKTVAVAIRDFFAGRLEVIARDRGYSADTVDAVLATGVLEPVDVLARCKALEDARKRSSELFEDLATAYARANNLRDPKLSARIDRSALGEPECTLLDAIVVAEKGVSAALGKGDYSVALEELATLRKPIDVFFDEVLIMDKDPEIQKNRLRLLNRFVGVFGDVADFGKLAG